jgi:RNA polymerase sigma-70 factor (ECF subfamily)
MAARVRSLHRPGTMGHDDGASRMDPERERSLVARARSDGAAFGELYDFYLPRIHGFVARRVTDRATTEDLAAMTFERALGAVRSGSFRNESFGGWLYRVAANAIVDHARRSRRLVPLGIRAGDLEGVGGKGPRDRDATEACDAAAADAFAATLDRDQLRRALLGLAETHRRVLVLKFYDDLSTDELCATLDCSPATLAVKLHRALRALRDAIAKEATDAA